MTHEMVIEMAPFSLADGVNEAQMRAASERLERESLASVPGYLGRMLARRGEREYVDIVLWRSQEDAERMIEVARTSAVCASYFSCMQIDATGDPGESVTHLPVLRTYGRLTVVSAAG